ncbi:MAG TPA: cytochrome c oxidase subunit 3, partial [Kofleriaceae bacterium]|nr:cytochrome c oxidase subunit 3 [Kofleriaceae bacterium]
SRRRRGRAMTPADDAAPAPRPRKPAPPVVVSDATNHERRWRIAVWTVIASEALLFSGLFALYAGYRSEHAAAFAAGVRGDDAMIGGINTLVLLTSSFAMAWAVHRVRAGRRGVAAVSLACVLVLGAVFLALKGLEWSHHIADGVVPGAAYHGPDRGPGIGLFVALYFGMTGLHALHVVAGLALVAWMLSLVVRGKAGAGHPLPVELVGLYWHFVDAIWVFLWPLFYLMRT